MSTEQILKVLKNERECIARQGRPLGEVPQCRKDEDGVKLCELCDLCLPEEEILAVYDFLIGAYELAETEGVNEYGRKIFNGICPYTNKKCDTWTCNTCEVEARERKFMEGDTE